jgi:hypothetical protein
VLDCEAAEVLDMVTTMCAYPIFFNFYFQVAGDYDLFSDRSTPPLVSVQFKCFSLLPLSFSGHGSWPRFC